VRHAEKAPPQPDDRQTPLNQEGNIRAEKLVHVLRRACVTEVYATEYLRTQQTVQPLAGALKLSLKIYNGGDAAGLVNMILSEHNGDVVLVAGHSNTVPRIAAQFGANINGQQIISDYDNLLMVTHTRDKSNVINFQYGQSSHPDSPGMTACEMTTILLVRDVQAGPAGINRAQKLVHVGQKAGVTVIYSTSSNLSRNTVQPLANELNLNILNYDVNDVQSLIDTILSQHSGKVVLITGQRDTMYQIINKINGHPLSPIYINEYDNLFVLTVYRSGDTKVVNLQYGEESP
jgi:phosphohistidine phosphatase SixA